MILVILKFPYRKFDRQQRMSLGGGGSVVKIDIFHILKCYFWPNFTLRIRDTFCPLTVHIFFDMRYMKNHKHIWPQKKLDWERINRKEKQKLKEKKLEKYFQEKEERDLKQKIQVLDDELLKYKSEDVNKKILEEKKIVGKKERKRN